MESICVIDYETLRGAQTIQMALASPQIPQLYRLSTTLHAIPPRLIRVCNNDDAIFLSSAAVV